VDFDSIDVAHNGFQRWGHVNMVMNLLQGTLKVEAAGLLQNTGVYLSDYAASHPRPPSCLQGPVNYFVGFSTHVLVYGEVNLIVYM
jgi:hypothetical protein